MAGHSHQGQGRVEDRPSRTAAWKIGVNNAYPFAAALAAPFLSGTLAAGAGVFVSRFGCAAGPAADSDHFVLLADPHVGSRVDQQGHGVNPARNLERAVAQIGRLDFRPAGAIVAGDCAFAQGETGDYRLFGQLLRPLRQAGLPLHFGLGNHDHRDRFLAAFPDAKAHGVRPPVPSKFVSMIETPHANWLLDSLDKTGKSKGLLGEAQLAWLGKSLDARAGQAGPGLGPPQSRPASQHPRPDRHRPAVRRARAPASRKGVFLRPHALLADRPRVEDSPRKHPHHRLALRAGPTAGAAHREIRPDGATIGLHTLDPQHAKHGQKVDLQWRT